LHLFRIGQEALTNALRHARSQRLWLEIEYQPQRVRLQVRDDGQGFDPNHGIYADGFGLIGMRQRAERIGGQLTIASHPGQGTAVVVEVPLRPQDPRQSLARGNADGPG
jgi:signal transduction histidine kinase